MRKLRCEVVGGDYFTKSLVGRVVIVKRITSSAIFGWKVEVEVEGGMPNTLKNLFGDVVSMMDENLKPLDCEDIIPEQFRVNQNLKNVWVFGEVKNDAFNRNPPSDLARFEETYGHPWTDSRVFDVGRLSY